MKVSVCRDGMGRRNAPIPRAFTVRMRGDWKWASERVQTVLSDRIDKAEDWISSFNLCSDVIVAMVDCVWVGCSRELAIIYKEGKYEHCLIGR